ncbi:hypothetical protein D3C81_1671930 [compost metagenome]
MGVSPLNAPSRPMPEPYSTVTLVLTVAKINTRNDTRPRPSVARVELGSELLGSILPVCKATPMVPMAPITMNQPWPMFRPSQEPTVAARPVLENREKSAICAQVQEKPKARSMKKAMLWVGTSTLKLMIWVRSHRDSTT